MIVGAVREPPLRPESQSRALHHPALFICRHPGHALADDEGVDIVGAFVGKD